MTKWDLPQGCKDGSIFTSQCDTSYYQTEEQKIIYSSQQKHKKFIKKLLISS